MKQYKHRPLKHFPLCSKASLIGIFYILQKKCTELLKISNIVVADAYFVKQATGLIHCQARSINKQYSHFNFALTAVNFAKIAHWKSDPTGKQPFSIANIKLLKHNKIMIDTFIHKFYINPNLKKNHKIVKELMLHGIKTA